MTLDGLTFDNLLFPPFTFMVGFVRAKASVHPLISDDVVMHVVVKGDEFEFIGCGRIKKWIVLCELFSKWF